MEYLSRRISKGNPYYDIMDNKGRIAGVPAVQRAPIEAELRIVNAFLEVHCWPEQYNSPKPKKRAGIRLELIDGIVYLREIVSPTPPKEKRFPEKAKEAYVRKAKKTGGIIDCGFMLDTDRFFDSKLLYKYRKDKNKNSERWTYNRGTVNQSFAMIRELKNAVNAPDSILFQCVQKSPNKELLIYFTPEAENTDKTGT
jgi:hypothetical protein